MKSTAGWKQVAPAVAQIIENDCLMAFFDEEARNSTSDVPGPAGHKNLHKKTILATTSLVYLKSIRVVPDRADQSSRMA